MRASIPTEVASTLDNDEFLNILDMIMDWMEENGLTDVDVEDDDLDNDREELVRQLVAYVEKMLKKDPGASFPIDYVEPVVVAELDYEDEICD